MDDDSKNETDTFGEPPPESFELPPEDEVDEEDVVTVDLRGEGDWMHPPSDDEGSGYTAIDEIPQETRNRELVELHDEAEGISRDLDAMTPEEIAREASRIREHHQDE